MEKKSFKFWFTEVFWFHYKTPFLVILGVAVFAVITIIQSINSAKDKPDFLAAHISGSGAVNLYQEVLDAHIAELGFNARSTPLFLDESFPTAWEQLMIMAINEEYAVFITDDSALPYLEGYLEGFYNAKDLGFTPSDADERLVGISVPGIDMPLYAMVKVTIQNRDGDVKPEDAARAEAAKAFVAALIKNE